MQRPSAATGIAVAVTTAFLLLPGGPARGAGDDPVRSVRVINFPPVQRVTGTVSIEGTIPHSILTTFKDLSIPPVEPTETGRLIDGGILQADGFTGLVLSLSGRAGGRALRSGAG